MASQNGISPTQWRHVMHKIVVITHEHDEFLTAASKKNAPKSSFRLFAILHEFLKAASKKNAPKSPYLLFAILRELEPRGYTIEVVKGPQNAPDGDVGVLHVDTTFTPPEYVDYARSFPFCVNLGATDISKKRISGALLGPGEDWDGPVIVKSNLNAQAYPEALLNRVAERSGRARPFPDVRVSESYAVYDSLADVPQSALDDEALVIEKFIPEVDPDGCAVRFWVFCGDRERCNRYVSPGNMVKATNVIRREPVPVPKELRVLRRELGFDFGKFDFVMHDGRAVLLDANKTPGCPPRIEDTGANYLAQGFERLIGTHVRPSSGTLFPEIAP